MAARSRRSLVPLDFGPHCISWLLDMFVAVVVEAVSSSRGSVAVVMVVASSNITMCVSMCALCRQSVDKQFSTV